MSDKNLAAEVRRLTEIIKAVELQRTEALTKRAVAEANVTLLQESLRESQASLTSANGEIAKLRQKLLELESKNEKPAQKTEALTD